MADHRLIFIVVALCAVVVIVKLFEGRRGLVLRIERKRLMTAAELRFWRLLVAAVPDRAVFSQVSMGALLKPVGGLSRSEWWSNYGRYSQKIVDFVVVDPADGEVVAVVELDDRSHDAERDAARDRLMACGGYDVVRINVAERLDVRSIRARVNSGNVSGRVYPIDAARAAR